ncbi:MAG: hypothetical protein AB8B59_13120 [Maribacter sp.]
MKHILYLAFLILFFGCTSQVEEEDLKNLNGYWEIEKVVFPDGKNKNYKANTTIDFIKLEGFSGFRKKVQPKLDGTYSTSDDSESLQIIEIKKRFYMSYVNEFSERREQILFLDSNSFSTVSEEGLQYDYKRFQPIDILE